MGLSAARPQPAVRRRIAPGRDLLALQSRNPARYPFLLESVADGTARARYDILFGFPQETLRADVPGTFLSELDARWRAAAAHHVADPELPFSGGWFLYLGYELAQEVEPRLRLPLPAELPIAQATRIPAAIVRDRVADTLYLVAEAGQEDLVDAMAADLAHAPSPLGGAPSVLAREEDDPDAYEDAVRHIKEYIRAGDVFQVNLSREWRGRLGPSSSPAAVYHALRLNNPGPFAGLARVGDAWIASSSPERLVAVREGRIESRPIAGTRPRGAIPDEDLANSRVLLAHPKERAEHVMLIDLERNDLGRVCVPGSVEVDELMVLESYAHVHHIVSNVRGRLRAGVSPGEVIRAVFPGGTITGCPKVRCMEIIAELEQGPRGAYTGSMGYLNHNGSLDLNILIRTLVLDSAGRFSLRAGAGIVADSDPHQELLECGAKARGLLRALGEGSHG
ncbi:aminodeoxychorismate synthase component I [Ectothiorhodospiraceae bacterium 2226]|nr:aminodeoxychorismate synthase component I [Ectothiorhodospiraceae bacterium 2226]